MFANLDKPCNCFAEGDAPWAFTVNLEAKGPNTPAYSLKFFMCGRGYSKV